MNRPIAYGFALFLLAWAVAAFIYGQPWVGAALIFLGGALALWVNRRGENM